MCLSPDQWTVIPAGKRIRKSVQWGANIFYLLWYQTIVGQTREMADESLLNFLTRRVLLYVIEIHFLNPKGKKRKSHRNWYVLQKCKHCQSTLTSTDQLNVVFELYLQYPHTTPDKGYTNLSIRRTPRNDHKYASHWNPIESEWDFR